MKIALAAPAVVLLAASLHAQAPAFDVASIKPMEERIEKLLATQNR